MKSNRVLLLLGCVLCIVSNSVLAVKYIDAAPLAQSINVDQLQGNVVTVNHTVILPTITWGEDMRTIFANGNSTKTSGGSLFQQQSLAFDITRQDDFIKQVKSYVKGSSPFLRGTLTMVNLVNDLTKSIPDLQPVVIAQLSWSQGGDTLVVKSGIKTLTDLKGKTIVLQRNGPHIHLLNRALNDAGLTKNDVTIKWVKDLTNAEHTPLNAFYEDDVDAAFLITPDALTLTACASNCGIGDGSDNSVKGARILYSTKSANKIVADVYAVRTDYLRSHHEEVQQFVQQLFKAKEKVDEISSNPKSKAYRTWVKRSAKILMDDAALSEDAGALFKDAYHAGFADNIDFFTNKSNLRNFTHINDEIQAGLIGLGLVTSKSELKWAQWDFNKLNNGLSNTANVVVPKFNQQQVAAVLEQRRRQGTLEDSQFLTFPIYFKPNQNTFSESQYSKDFDKFLNYAATYGGAVITLEGHCDPNGYLKAKIKNHQPQNILNRLRQSCMNLSVTRASGVRDAIIRYAAAQGITLNPSQFETMGHGLENPATGMCGVDPCKINSKQEWLSNMRVLVGVTVIEAEVDTFETF